MRQSHPPCVLAVSSGGGHWVQMLRLRSAFDGANVHFATVDAQAAQAVAPAPVHIFADAHRGTKLRLILAAVQLALIVVKLRPDVVVTTGAAGGCIAIAFARALGARTMFIDSIANARQLSVSARLAQRVAHRVLCQWPDLAHRSGCEFRGAVL